MRWQAIDTRLILAGVGGQLGKAHLENWPCLDCYSTKIQPWVHYVPLNMDLADLREKYEWAESNPREAEKIAKAGQDYVAKMRSREWIQSTYNRYFANQLGAVVDAYEAGAEETLESTMDNFRDLELYLVCTRRGCKRLRYD